MCIISPAAGGVLQCIQEGCAGYDWHMCIISPAAGGVLQCIQEGAPGTTDICVSSVPQLGVYYSVYRGVRRVYICQLYPAHPSCIHCNTPPAAGLAIHMSVVPGRTPPVYTVIHPQLRDWRYTYASRTRRTPPVYTVIHPQLRD